MIVSAVNSTSFGNKQVIKRLCANKAESVYTKQKPIKNYSQYMKEYGSYIKERRGNK